MPAAYTSAQKKAIADFIQVTASDRSTAARVLKNHNWETQSAVNSFFNSSAVSTSSSSSRTQLTRLFDKYRDDPKGSPDTISITGTMGYFEALGVALDDVASFIVSEIVSCPSMGEMTRDGFLNGWSELNADTIDKQKAVIRQRRTTLGSPASRPLLKSIYKHTFRLGITNQGQRSVDKETCIEMWKMMLSPPSFDWSTRNTPWLQLWVEFVSGNSVKGINADVWNQTLVFAEESVKDETLKWWSEEAAWPALVDEFVEWMNEKRGLNKDEEMDDMEY